MTPKFQAFLEEVTTTGVFAGFAASGEEPEAKFNDDSYARGDTRRPAILGKKPLKRRKPLRKRKTKK